MIYKERKSPLISSTLTSIQSSTLLLVSPAAPAEVASPLPPPPPTTTRLFDRHLLPLDTSPSLIACLRSRPCPLRGIRARSYVAGYSTASIFVRIESKA
ncbi:hypothetical protein GUJ93_ZPchr0012g18956 [Zizania palustris]|uniref:Uncharacterized protein n=1 Tax=Zizania palustris TaxID=103762 RepID=A0A8J5WQ70_ZIZPA|nr:hypothetical protein GUJ93_ZPchr0012g18956 [Zizania palustris]